MTRRTRSLAAFAAVGLSMNGCSPCDGEPFGVLVTFSATEIAADQLELSLTSASERFRRSFPIQDQLRDGETSLRLTVTPEPAEGASIRLDARTTLGAETTGRGSIVVTAQQGACQEAALAIAPPRCGDGFVDGLEACDDGNDVIADGCSPTCETESSCVTDPGSCSTEVFVDARVPCPGSGTRESPYCKISLAIDSGSPSIRVADGTYVESLRISGKNMELQASGAVDVRPAEAGSAALSIEGGSSVAVAGLRLSSQNASTIEVIGNASLELVQAEVGPTDRFGVEVSDAASLTIRRSRVHDARRGGISFDSSGRLRAENSIFLNNGGAPGASGFGGARIRRAGGAEFVHCTLFDNDGGPQAGGIICDATTSIRNSILWRNAGNDTGFSNCNVSHSNVGAASGEPTNFATDPLLTADGHLSPGSACIDAGDGSDVSEDFDGQSRPVGNAVDVGADEFL